MSHVAEILQWLLVAFILLAILICLIQDLIILPFMLPGTMRVPEAVLRKHDSQVRMLKHRFDCGCFLVENDFEFTVLLQWRMENLEARMKRLNKICRGMEHVDKIGIQRCENFDAAGKQLTNCQFGTLIQMVIEKRPTKVLLNGAFDAEQRRRFNEQYWFITVERVKSLPRIKIETCGDGLLATDKGIVTHPLKDTSLSQDFSSHVVLTKTSGKTEVMQGVINHDKVEKKLANSGRKKSNYVPSFPKPLFNDKKETGNLEVDDIDVMPHKASPLERSDNHLEPPGSWESGESLNVPKSRHFVCDSSKDFFQEREMHATHDDISFITIPVEPDEHHIGIEAYNRRNRRIRLSTKNTLEPELTQPDMPKSACKYNITDKKSDTTSSLSGHVKQGAIPKTKAARSNQLQTRK